MQTDIFANELLNKAGGILISDIIDNEQIVLLGKSNIPNRLNEYEGFGGKYESCDLTSLHTAIREMIEEFFNIRASTEFINNLAVAIIYSNIIIKRFELYGMSYLINLDGLDFIFKNLIFFDNNLLKYKLDDKFNYKLYFQERIITDIPSNGINEIQSLHVIKIADIKNKIYDLRWYTSKIIFEMIIKNKKK